MKFSLTLSLLLAIVFQGFLVPQASAQLSQISSTTLSPTSFSVSWTTLTPQGSLVIYGPSASYGLSVSDLTPTTNHRLVITGVPSDKLTFFHIVQLPVDIKRENFSLYSTHLPGGVTAAVLTLTRTLTIGSTGEDVRQLQKFLNGEGIVVAATGSGSPGNETTYYGPATANAVSRFQIKYQAEILAPAKLSAGTGTVGPATRAKIAQLSATRTATGVSITGPVVAKPTAKPTTNTRGGGSAGGGSSVSPSPSPSPASGGGGGGGSSPSPAPSPSPVTPTPTPPASTKFSAGERVQVSSGPLNVRQTANGTLVGTQAVGSLGTVTGGPTGTGGFVWWSINFDSGVDGWSAEDFLATPVAPSPTPAPVPTPVPTPAPSPTPTPPAVTGSGSCFDNADNDSDGSIDMADMDCFRANGDERKSASSPYPQLNPSSDTRFIYVSDSEGNDSNNGLTPQTAVKTITKGISLARNGFPDWVMLKRGDVWSGRSPFSLGISGRSASEPLVIGAYGASAQRPQIFSHHFYSFGGASNYTMSGLHFERLDKSNPSNEHAIGINYAASNVTFNDLYIRDYGIALFIEGGSVATPMNNVKVLNSVIIDNDQHGILAGNATNMEVSGNVVDYNGWNQESGAQANILNHNMYMFWVAHLMTIRNNIIARGSSHGFSYPGGLVEDNLFIQNGIGIYTDDKHTVNIRKNVFSDGRDIDTASRGYGIFATPSRGQITENLFVNQVTASGNPAISLENANGMTIENNKIYNWWGKATSAFYNSAINFAGTFSGSNIVRGNTVVQPAGTLFSSAQNPFSTFAFSSNHYYNGGDAARWFSAPGQTSISKTGWAALSGESDATYTQPIFVEPSRGPATYNAAQGGASTIPAFLAEARKMSRLNASSDVYRAPVINNWIRSGFEVTGYAAAGTASTHTITASAGTGGTISPSGSVSVSGGFSQTFNVIPNSGQQVASVTVDGVNQGVITSYTFPNVSAAHTISATFTGSGVSKFVVGDRIQVTSNVNVRATPSTSGTLLGTQFAPAVGTIISGPTVANGFSWWNVNYDIGADGWSAEDFLIKSSTVAPTVPAAPSGMVASAIGSGQINVSWNSVSGALSYKIERSTSQTSGFTQILNISVSSISDTGLAANTTYYYRVRATNTAGDSGYSSTVNARTTAVVSGSGSSGAASCSDGVDNDGDGTTDTADLSCFGPNMREATTDPVYTMFTPSADSRIVYVSWATGNDSNSGLTPQAPKKNIRAGLDLLRDGYPDWLLLRRGDTWTTTSPSEMQLQLRVSGRSASEPIVLGTYTTNTSQSGTALERPHIVNHYFTSYRAGNSYFALVGWEFKRTDRASTENGTGVFLANEGGTDALLEDLFVSNYDVNVYLDGKANNPIRNVKVRNSVITDAWGQGILAGNLVNWLTEGNVIDYNGYNTAAGRPPNQFNHNVYGAHADHPSTLRNNIFGRASSHAISMEGGLIENNSFILNPIGVHSDNYLTATGNVFGTGNNIEADAPRGYGIWVTTAKGGEYYKNYFVHQVNGSDGSPIFGGGGVNNLSIHDNIIHNWCPTCNADYTAGMYFSSPMTAPNSIVNNVISQVRGIMYRFQTAPGSAFSISGNHYYLSNGNINRWFDGGDNSSVSKSQWSTFSGETNATYGQINFPDASRTFATYNASLGRANSYTDFLDKSRELSKSTYDARWTAAAANTWIKAGYDGYTISADTSPNPPPASPPPSPTPAPSPAPAPAPSPSPAPSPTPSPAPSPSPTPPASPSGDVTTGSIARLTFDGSGTDSVGSYNASLSGGAQFVSGKIGQAVSLDGTNDQVSFSIPVGTTHTVSVWVNPAASGGDFEQYIFSNSNGSNGLTYRPGSGNIYGISGGSGSGFHSITSNSWHHIVLSVSNGTATAYVNGVFRGGFQMSATTYTSLSHSNGVYSGLIDDLRIYSRALSASDVSALYNGGAGVASAQRNNSFLGNLFEGFKSLFR